MGIIDYDRAKGFPDWAQEPANRQRLTRWLEEKFPDPPGLRCPGCGKDEWTIGRMLASPYYGGAARGRLDEHLPQIPLRCNHCACLVRLDATEVGVEF